MNFYVSITTIRKYKVALDMLLQSLPDEWKNKYILVYQDEEENGYKIFDDGHIEVYIVNNLSDYGNWVGINMLLQKNVVPQDTWFLFIHDTCKFLNNSLDLTYEIIKSYNNSEIDILWLCDSGRCNICLIRKNGVLYGNNLYKNIIYMTKMETIKYEWDHKNNLSPKSFCVSQKFLNSPAKQLGKRFVYNNKKKRDVLLYESINLEKYFYHTEKESDHPLVP